MSRTKKSHEPLCPHDTHPYPETCETCLLIAQVRADEQRRADQAGWMPASLVYDNLRAKVEALHVKAEVVGLSERAFAYEVVLKLMGGSSNE